MQEKFLVQVLFIVVNVLRQLSWKILCCLSLHNDGKIVQIHLCAYCSVEGEAYKNGHVCPFRSILRSHVKRKGYKYTYCTLLCHQHFRFILYSIGWELLNSVFVYKSIAAVVWWIVYTKFVIPRQCILLHHGLIYFRFPCEKLVASESVTVWSQYKCTTLFRKIKESDAKFLVKKRHDVESVIRENGKWWKCRESAVFQHFQEQFVTVW